MYAPRFVAALSVLLCGAAHAQWIVPNATGQVRIGSSCSLNDGRRGVCKKAEHCQEFIEELNKKHIQPTTCFFDHLAAVPCCPLKELSSPLTSQLTPTVAIPPTPITTPTGPTLDKPFSCLDPVEDWSPSPEEERSLLKLAQQKCVEYWQHVYQLVPSSPETAGEEFIYKSTCGMDNKPLIVGSKPASPQEFPHTAVIGYGDGETSWLCGGSLISGRHILTVAHCVRLPRGECVQRVLLGTLSLKETSPNTELQEFNIVRRLIHPRYKPSKRYNDIAILELDRDVSITGSVRPACLYDSFTPPEFDMGIAAGFCLQDRFNTEVRNILFKVTMPFQPLSQCNETYKESGRLPNGINDEGMLCAVLVGGSKDTCKVFSGSPIQVRDINHCMYKIIGVTSFGSQRRVNESTVFTRVSSYISWIAKVVWM